MKSGLHKYTNDELRRELDKRDRARTAPRVLDSLDWSSVVAMFEEHNAKVIAGEMHEDDHSDFVHFVYEEVAKTMYGSDYFDWFNGAAF